MSKLSHTVRVSTTQKGNYQKSPILNYKIFYLVTQLTLWRYTTVPSSLEMMLLNVAASVTAMPFHTLRAFAARVLRIPPVSQAMQLASNATTGPHEVTELDARVSGTMPEDLRGMFVNVCPNPQHLPIGGYHVFEGDGSLTAVRVRDDSASFSFRHLKTEKATVERSMGRSTMLSLSAINGASGLALLALSALRRAATRKSYNESPANTNILVHARCAYALWEGALPYQLSVA
eukprot:IDg1277t1